MAAAQPFMSQDTTWKRNLGKLPENGIKEHSDFRTPYGIDGENKATAMMESLSTVKVSPSLWLGLYAPAGAWQSATAPFPIFCNLLEQINTGTSANTV